MKRKSKIIILTLVTSIIFFVPSLTAIDITQNKTTFQSQPYTGDLRVYIVEPSSRWDNYDRDPYHYGFLDFAIEETLSIDYLDTYTTETTWIASEAGYSNVKENNVIVIATVFNPEVNKAYSYPPANNPFDAHYVDATAGAEPGETGYNTVTEDFTHTVFVEEGTAGWCPYCPAMAEALNSVYQSGDYPFYFVALITKDRQRIVVNQEAINRLENDYNLYGYPTAFFDGGKKVLVGGYDAESYYRSRIEQCGRGDVHELGLSVSVEWLGDGNLDISVNITNNEEIANSAPDTPDIQGPASGKIKEEQVFTVSTTDPEDDDVYYWMEWYDGYPDGFWQGPYASGEEVPFSYTWTEEGTYTVRVKAKDIYGTESDWATLEVSMPKLKGLSNIFSFKLFDYLTSLRYILRNILL